MHTPAARRGFSLQLPRKIEKKSTKVLFTAVNPVVHFIHSSSSQLTREEGTENEISSHGGPAPTIQDPGTPPGFLFVPPKPALCRLFAARATLHRAPR